MNALAAISHTSSIELLLIINESRLEFGEKEVRRNDFVARCKDELLGEHYESFVVKNSNGTVSEELRMTNDQCAYVSMRESKAVRRRVTERLNVLRVPPKFDPNTLTRSDILKLALEAEESKLKAEAERDHAIATKAQIGSKREATALATASAAKREVARLQDQLGDCSRHATVLAVEKATGKKYPWLPLRRWCEANGGIALDVADTRYGHVKSWPRDAWGEVYAVDLVELMGGV